MRAVCGAVAVALVMCVPSAVSAQQGTADLTGRVVDQQGSALPGVAIVVRHQESGLFREVVSQGDGAFHLSGMTPGVYEVSAELTGFRRYVKRDVTLVVGRTTPLTITLDVGGVQETVTVTGEAPLVDTSTKEIGGTVSAKEFVEIPSFNRNFAGYLGMLPGVVATVSLTTFGADSISVAGQNVRNVNFTMDGSNNNDTFNGGNGGAQARVPVEAVQEFQLLSSQFDAEYGLASGGIVNSVSKSGTNQFRGSAFAFFQDESMTALDYFAAKQGLDKAPTKQQQFGGTLGGPIKKDRVHFFGSVERVIIDGGTTIVIPSRPELNRTDFETTRVWNTFFRADHQLNAGNTWGVRWLRETSPQPVQINGTNHTPSRYEAETDIDWTVVGNLSSVLSSNKVNTFRVSAVKEDVFFGNPRFNETKDQRSLPPTLNYLSFSDQQSPRASRRLDVAYGADNVFAWFIPNKKGDHDLKFGVNYLYSSLRVQDHGNMNGTFTFNTDLPFDRLNPRTYPERLSIRVAAPVNFLMKGHFIGFFAQDKWKIRDLTLSLGLRYDVELIRTPNQENPLFADDPNGYPIDADNFAPRVGFSYALDRDGRSALRGGFGVFFQRTSYTFLTGLFSAGRNSTSFTANFPTNNIDPGPRAGNFPTDPFLANGPTVNQALIDALFPPGTRQRNVGTVNFDNPDRQVAWARQFSLGYERQIGPSTGVSIDFIRSEQRDQYMSKDLNPALRATPLATGAVARRNPLVGSVGEFAARVSTLVNEGWIDYTTLQVAVTQRATRGLTARLSYAFSRGRGNTGTGQGDTINSQYLGELRLDAREIGPTNVDRPHILSISGSYDVPRTGGLKLSGVLQARSGTPFSLIDTTFDADQNGITANEYLPAGTYRGNGQDPYEVDYKGGRNGARGPNYLGIDFRAGYQFRLPSARTFSVFLDVFNLTNEPNFANPAGDRRQAATFLNLTSIFNGGPTRTVQLNARYAF
ncbi:MAG: carboxypeptidase regulatory-like domain-containing protein [Acidobacteriota bacterium]